MKLLRIADMMEKLSISKSGFHVLVQTPDFPKPIYLTSPSGAPSWIDTEIDAWVQAKADARTNG